jgi:hypothetical protein
MKDHTLVITENKSTPYFYKDNGYSDMFGHGLDQDEWSKGRFNTTYDKTIRKSADEKDLLGKP